jgi:glyoxylate/hydroxypyruvate reductase A
MSLVIISPGKDPNIWIDEFHQLDPELEFEIFPEVRNPEKVTTAFVWNHPIGILNTFPNLKLISSMGAGVDHILKDDSIADHIPIVRIVDEKLTFSMTNYVVMAVLNFHRQLTRYQKNQSKKNWDMSNPEIEVTIGVMGVGALGKDVLDKLNNLGFPVVGYGYSEKINFEYPYYSKNNLSDFLKKINVLVCLLPLTPETENILDKRLFNQCTPATYIINVARGKHLVDADLIEAIESGQVFGAMLDVYRHEPLPKSHPFWMNSRITMTPHIASVTNPQAAAPQVIENIRRRNANQELINVVVRSKGY